MPHRPHVMTLALTAAAVVALGAQVPASLPAAAAAKIDALVTAAHAEQKMPGISLAIAVRNELVYSKGFGLADLEHRVPVKVTTAFRTASVAKPLTAAGVMALVEAGRIDLDGPVRRYCEAWPDTHPPITVRQVLGHLAGIRHYVKQGESAGKDHYFALDDALALFKDDPLLHEPGTKYSYSTYGYTLAGCAIEGASAQSYERFMRKRIFERAGMARTRLDRTYDVIPDRARGYLRLTKEAFDTLPPAAQAIARPGEIYNAELHDTSMKVAGGGLVSTAEDLVRFGIALTAGTLLKKETVERMWTAQTTADGSATGYGLGFGVQATQEGMRRVSHSGNQSGGGAQLVILPEAGITYAIMTNLGDAELAGISRGIANVLRETYSSR